MRRLVMMVALLWAPMVGAQNPTPAAAGTAPGLKPFKRPVPRTAEATPNMSSPAGPTGGIRPRLYDAKGNPHPATLGPPGGLRPISGKTGEVLRAAHEERVRRGEILAPPFKVGPAGARHSAQLGSKRGRFVRADQATVTEWIGLVQRAAAGATKGAAKAAMKEAMLAARAASAATEPGQPVTEASIGPATAVIQKTGVLGQKLAPGERRVPVRAFDPSAAPVTPKPRVAPTPVGP